MAVRAVLLDFYGTLAEAVDWGPSFEEVLRAHDCEPPAEGLWRSFETDGHEHREHSVSRAAYLAWERERIRRLACDAGMHPARLEAAVDDLHRAAKSYELRVFEEVQDALDELRARGLDVGICSNWDWDLPDLVERLGLGDAVDAVVTSARAGARKPHPSIYATALDALGAEPATTLFAGDTWEADVEGPVRAGMRAVHVHRLPDGEGDPGAGAGLAAGDELPDLLAGSFRAPDLRGLLDALDADLPPPAASRIRR